MGRLTATILTIFALAPAAHAGSLDPSSLKDEIQTRGAKAVVDELFRSGAWENIVIKEIGAGSVPWIGLAPALSKGADAATSEELGDSLIHALPKAPEAVLSVIDLSGESIPRAPDTVCSAAFFEGDPTDPQKYRRAAIQAVGHVGNPALASAKRACLNELEAVR